MGGALGRPAPAAAPATGLTASTLFFVVGFPRCGGDRTTPSMSLGLRRGRTYFNFMPRRTGRETATGRRSPGLADLYEAVDPEGLIDHPHRFPAPPASPTSRHDPGPAILHG